MNMHNDGAIGIFDSGVGGLSVLRHIRARLPHEALLYFADSAYAPYGDKTEEAVIARSLAVTAFFMQQRIKALVVACNTATATAIQAIRATYPTLPVVGVEPGLKPAAAITASRIVGVLATERTLASDKFARLRAQISAATGARFLTQACIGLADQIEKGELRSAATALLVRRYVEPLIEQRADTLVLGCTHYPFVRPLIEEVASRLTSRRIEVVDTGDAVARQLERLLDQRGLRTAAREAGSMVSFTTGSESSLADAFLKLLNLYPQVAGLRLA